MIFVVKTIIISMMVSIVCLFVQLDLDSKLFCFISGTLQVFYSLHINYRMKRKTF